MSIEYKPFVSTYYSIDKFDIVTALERAAKDSVWPAPHHAVDTLYHKAAEEIKKLRAKLEEASRGYGV